MRDVSNYNYKQWLSVSQATKTQSTRSDGKPMQITSTKGNGMQKSYPERKL